MHFPPKFLQNAPPTFSMVHLLHRLYGVDAPVRTGSATPYPKGAGPCALHSWEWYGILEFNVPLNTV